jgi:glycerate dehydrogenase
MKIVILDGHTTNPGDLSWDELARYGTLTVIDKSGNSADEIVENIGDAEIILTNKTPIPKEVMERAPNLKYIGVLATGYDAIDTRAAKQAGIFVTNVPGYATVSVAQMTFALLLELCHHVGAHSDAVRRGEWTASTDFCFWNYPLIELYGKTMGIIGFGKIGRASAAIALAFGMKVLAVDSTRYPELENESCRYTDLDTLFRKSDVVSLHCPYRESTRHIINRESLACMKKEAFLINTARGLLVNEQDLSEALNSDIIAGAAVDVVSSEPIDKSNPLLTAKNCIVTPHIGWAPRESRERLINIAINNLKAFIEGNPQNVVN